MSDQEIIVPGAAGMQKYGAEDFAAVSKSGDYLGRLQLMSSNSKDCKNGSFPVNHYAFIRDQKNTDLGERVDVLNITWRPKAMDMNDEIIAVHDPNDPEFQRIQVESEGKDSGCMYGSEYLVWIPQISTFATFFMGSKSARKESPNMQARLGKACTLDSRLVDPPKSKFSWQVPVIKPCTTVFELPDTESMNVEVEKFNNPPAVEVAPEDDGSRAR